MRINIIDPKYLADQHLIAEIREIKMLPKSLIRSIKSKKGVDLQKIKKMYPTYTLNTGHGVFFYDKIKFIENRFQLLIEEALNRDFKLKDDTKSLFCKDYDYSLITDLYYNDYIPTQEEQDINIDRIILRIIEEPFLGFYKYRGVKFSQAVNVEYTFLKEVYSEEKVQFYKYI